MKTYSCVSVILHLISLPFNSIFSKILLALYLYYKSTDLVIAMPETMAADEFDVHILAFVLDVGFEGTDCTEWQ